MRIAILTLIAFCRIPDFLTAQSPAIQFGLSVMTGYSTVDYHNKNRPEVEEAINLTKTWRYAPGITFSARKDFGSLIGLEVGGGVSLTGDRVKKFVLNMSTPEKPEPVRVGEAWGQNHYLDLIIPVSVRIRPVERFYIKAGLSPALSLMRWKTIRIDYDSGEKFRDSEKVTDGTGFNFHPFNLRADLGCGYYVSASSGIYIEPLFSFTLFPVYEDDGMGQGQVLLGGVNVGMDF